MIESLIVAEGALDAYAINLAYAETPNTDSAREQKALTGAGGSEQADATAETQSDNDPFQVINKPIHHFNDFVDTWTLKPVASLYDAALPGFISRGVSNFFSNIGEPRVVLNDILQGKLGQALSDTVRFVINTTIGVGGLLDPAAAMGFKRHDEDFGQTLGRWGIGPGPYVVIPLLGPSSVRDAFGELVDFFTYPLYYFQDVALRDRLYLLRLVDLRAGLLKATELLEEAAGGDAYAFMREAYFQRRKNQVYDGNPPEDDLPYSLDEEEEGAKP